MCGIAGYVYKDINRKAELQLIKIMTDIIKYRGPDDEGHYIFDNIALGHRRLSIIDLSEAGHQPMISFDDRYIIVFNGEIYNYRELAKELKEKGCSFKSGTDTEVLLEAYRVWGKDCVERFNGMWAFAIFDKYEKNIFFSRDRFGIKPLYYLNREDILVFGSEIKEILAAFPEERNVNESYMYHFLPSGAFDDGNETFFENIFSLEPAHSAIYDIEKKDFKIWKYWDVDENLLYEKWIKERDPVETLWNLLNSSIDLHLRSDVPVGTCLSGGVDSSTIVGIASKKVGTPMYTFSGVYKDEDCDEKQYVDCVNENTFTTPNVIYPEPNGTLIEDLVKMTWHQDEPTAGPGLYTQYHVMKMAGKQVKVLLDGQGADELFAGYLPYYSYYINDLLSDKSCNGKEEALSLVEEIKKIWGYKWISDENLKGIYGIEASNMRKDSTINSQKPDFFHKDFAERIKGKEIKRDFPKRLKGSLSNTLYLHLVKQSIPALLHYEDRNSMAFSVEARVPMLDYRIVEFAMGLPSNYKIKDSWTKWILRKLCEKVVPHKIAWRRSKLGYTTPFSRWIRTGKDKELITKVLFSQSFLDRKLVPKETIEFYYNEHMSGKIDMSWLLYRYVVVELWYRMFIDEFSPNINVV